MKRTAKTHTQRAANPVILTGPAVLAAALLLFACGTKESTGPLGTLTVHLAFAHASELDLDFEPSYQTAVWLEDEDGKYVVSILVSEYLSYGGYEEPEICPRWSKSSRWGEVDEAVFDAVTRATPPVGASTVTVDCAAQKLDAGVYHYCVQTHIMEKDNIFYRGRIEIGGAADESRADRSGPPIEPAAARDLLREVSAEYEPAEK